MVATDLILFCLGFVMFSVQHPDVPPPDKGYTRIGVDHSGMLLSLHPGPSIKKI